MEKHVAVVLFSPRSGCLCSEVAMLHASGQPALVVPTTILKSGETVTDAASRLVQSLGSDVAPSLWKTAGIARNGSTEVMTAIVSINTLALLNEKKVSCTGAEWLLCDAWVNPRRYEPDFLALMAMARAIHVQI